MSKKNKWTIVPFIIVALLIITFLYFITIHQSSKSAEPLKAVPVNASIIIKINNFEGLFNNISQKNAFWNELMVIPGFNRINRQLIFIDSLIRTTPEVREIFSNPPSFISAHAAGKDRISMMHVFQLPGRMHEKKIIDLITNMVRKSGTVRLRNYEGIDLHEVALLNQSRVKNFYFAVYHDLFMMSFSSTVIEDAIRQLISGESLTDEPEFNRIYATAGKNVNANILINFNELPRSISAFINTEFKSEVRSFRNFAGWAELDLNLMPDMVLMNGFINAADSVPSIASILLSQSPQRVQCDEVLPASLASFITMQISDAERYFEGYRNILKEQGRLASYDHTLLSLNTAYGINLPSDITNLMDKEITIGFDGDSINGNPPAVYLLLRIRSKTQTEDKMSDILEKISAVESKPLATFFATYDFDSDLTFSIGHLPVNCFTSKIFGNLFAALNDHYYVVLDNYLVFSESIESIKELIRNYILNKTLRNNEAYKEFRNNLSPRSNLYFYCDLSRSHSFFSRYLTSEVSREWQKYLPVFQNIRVLGVQIYSNNNMLYSNLLLRHQSSYSASAQTVWESRLDTLAAFKPVFVMNHQTRQNEVFVQDMNKNIYLINQVGRILWKIQLPDAINSEVFQIDYFRNGKLQLLFSTRNELYMIDRNGNYVEKYPVKLRSAATCGVAVFDYDNNRDYRMFIACEDKHVYAYTANGNLVQGWGFGETESEVTQPVNHFRLGDKDFVVFGDRFKTYILDRKGNTRVNIETWFPRSQNNNYQIDLPRNGMNPSVVTTDTAGRVYFIGFNGNVRTVDLPGKISASHFFDLKDINGDGVNEYIFLDGEKLTVFNNDQTKLFTHKFEEAAKSKPQFYQFSATDRKLGVVIPDKNQIWLINNDGRLYEGFPLQGNTPFSIGNFGDSLSRFNLVVGSRDNFLYNYRVK